MEGKKSNGDRIDIIMHNDLIPQQDPESWPVCSI